MKNKVVFQVSMIFTGQQDSTSTQSATFKAIIKEHIVGGLLNTPYDLKFSKIMCLGSLTLSTQGKSNEPKHIIFENFIEGIQQAINGIRLNLTIQKTANQIPRKPLLCPVNCQIKSVLSIQNKTLNVICHTSFFNTVFFHQVEVCLFKYHDKLYQLLSTKRS